jgi:hypothetical protein
MPTRGEYFRLEARRRWLLPEEIVDILANHKALGFKIAKGPPDDPKSGDLYLYDRRVTKDFKHDGIPWIRKNNYDVATAAANSILSPSTLGIYCNSHLTYGGTREEFVRLKVGGVHAITGFYTSSSVDANFRRRCYKKPSKSFLYLVHYRRDVSKSRFKKEISCTSIKATSNEVEISSKLICPAPSLSDNFDLNLDLDLNSDLGIQIIRFFCSSFLLFFHSTFHN